jgi:DNA repair protein RadC
MIDKKQKHKSEGHRKRLREKFLKSGLAGFQDYEIIEILLILGTPRKDCKSIAKDAIKKFKGFNNVLDASTNELQQIRGIGLSNIFGLKLFQAVYEKYSREKIKQSLKLNSSEEIFNYLKEKIGKKKKEYFIVMFFDTKNNLIVDDISVGTLNASLVHPREVFNKAIEKHASYIVVAHNHPSGDIEPSDSDIKTTKRLIEAGKIIGITVADHIIVSRNGYISLRDETNYF